MIRREALVCVKFRCALYGLVTGLLFVAPSAIAQNASRGSLSNQTAAIDAALSKVSPSLVRIHVVTVDYQDGREVKREASGSGTIITPEGHVITNHHVAGRTRTIICTLANREELPAQLVGTDPLSDLAVLKLMPPKPRVFPAAQFGDPSTLRVGDRVLALGSPLALSQSVTMGIVSNTEMIMPGMFWPFNRMTLEGEDVGSIVRWIGHDAPIFGGNSGGPLVSMDGTIVGINEISLGLAGAIPSDLAREVSAAIIRDGKVRRSWIGLEVQPLLKSSPAEHGALVSGTIEGSPAAKAGFESGDILVGLGGRTIDVRFAEELPLFNQFVMRLSRGQPVEATVVRRGERKTLSVVPDDRESVEAPIVEVTALGMTGSNLTSWAMKELKRADRAGVRVRGVRPGGPADDAKPSIADDDVIVALDGQPVKNVEALAASIDHLARSEGASSKVLVTFERNTERLLTVVEIGRAGLQDPGLEARKAWVPVSVQVLTRDLADKLGVADRTGVRVTRVLRGAATSAGLQVGDIITAIDGEPVQATQPSDAEVFGTMIRQYKIGASVRLSTIRDRESRQVTVQLEASPRLSREMKKYEDPNFEFRVRDVAPGDRSQTGLAEGQPGVLVEAVREGGWAALGHLADGDVILSIDGESAADVASVQQKMERIAAAKPSSVVLKVKRGIRTFFVEMQTGWK
jgi:serine protease Do